MRRQRALLASVKIDKPGQVKLFQVRLPRETEVIGIETGMRWIGGTLPQPAKPTDWILPMFVSRNIVLGEVKLQSCKQANIFYTGELLINRNIDFADFSSRWWTPKAHSHIQNRYQDEVNISGDSTIIQGIYRDKLSDTISDYSYTANIYVWVEAKERSLK